MTIHINQSIKTFSIDWTSQKVGRKKAKKLPLLGFGPQTWKTWNLMWKWNCHSTLKRKRGKAPDDAYCFTQCSNGCALGSFLFRRQDNHVQRCTTVSPNRWEEASERARFFVSFIMKPHHLTLTTPHFRWCFFFSFFFRCTKEPHKKDVVEQKFAERRETKEHAKKRWGGKNKRGENFQLTHCWSSASSSHGALFEFSRRCFVFLAIFCSVYDPSPSGASVSELWLSERAVAGILFSPPGHHGILSAGSQRADYAG